MSYWLSYAGFLLFLERIRRSYVDKDQDVQDAHSEAVMYILNGFNRCHDKPIPDEALYPRPRTCEAADFGTEEKWNNSFAKLVRKRKISSQRWITKGGRQIALGYDADVWHTPAGDNVAEQAVANDAYQTVLDALLAEFGSPGLVDGPMILVAMSHTVDDLRAGDTGSIGDLVRGRLRAELPDRFAGGLDDRQRERRRQRLHRIVERAERVVKERLDGSES